MNLLMGIDIGTSKTAVSLIDPERKEIVKTVEGETPYLENIEPWKKEQSPKQIIKVLKDLFTKCIDDKHKITAIGITGQMHGILGLDKKGAPITNFVTWQVGRGNIKLDGNKTVIDEIRQKAGNKNISGIASGFGLVTLYFWLKNGLRPYKISTIGDYIGMLLTGNVAPYINPTMAESLGCFDLENNNWNTTFLNSLGISTEIFPNLIKNTEVIGVTKGNAFSDILKDKAQVVVSIGDNQASFLGGVKYHTETLLLNIGTGAQISIAEESYQKASQLPFIDGFDVQIRPFINDKYLIAGNAISGGVVYKTLFNFFKSVGSEIYGISKFDDLYKNMETIAQKATYDENADKLEVYPLFAGKRSTPQGKGWIHGIRLTNLQPDILILETLKGMIRILVEMFDHKTIESKSYLVGSGNGIRKNKLLQRLIQNELKRKLKICSYSEEAVVGASINAAVATGVYSNFQEASELVNYKD